MAFDPFTSTLDFLSGNNRKKTNVSNLTQESDIAQGQFADAVGRASLLAGGSGVTEESIDSINKKYLTDTTFTEQSAQTKSILGGQSVDAFLKAFRGYVTQRSGAIEQAQSRPGRKQTFLGGTV